MSDNPVHLILSKVEGARRTGDGYTFRCPAHDDKRQSAFAKPDASGNVILKCFAGCSRKAICAALGLSESDLYVNKRRSSRSQTIASYPYYDADGRLLYEHRRLLAPDGSKTFLYCRQDGQGNTLWTLGGGWFELRGKNWKRVEQAAPDPAKRPTATARWFDESPRALYRLGDLRKAAPGALVLYCEGEKDVESAERLGFLATTAGGASDWRAQFASDLEGFDVVIIPDNDSAGRQCAVKVARACEGRAARVRILALPDLAEHGDLSDWIAAGGTRETLLRMLADEEQPCIFTLARYLQNLDMDVHHGGDTETDISDLPEVETDDPPISADPKREYDLRQLAWNAAKVIDACLIILRLLGFQLDHSRLVNALIAIGGARLGFLWLYQAVILERYAIAGEARSLKTLQRDIKRLRGEQAALGRVAIDYRPGGKNLSTDKPYPCRFKNLLLRYALEAISIAWDTRANFKTARQALEAACQEVVSRIPHFAVLPPPAHKEKSKTVEDYEAQFGKLQEQLLAKMLDDGWTQEEIEAELELLQRRFYERLKAVCAERDAGQSAGQDDVGEEVISI